MKTILRINPLALDSAERIAEEKLPALAFRMLVEAYAKRRGGDSLLVVDQAPDGLPVYITVGSRPPELAIGGRQVYAVFDPPDSQEPLASFFDEAAATAWRDASAPDGKIGKIDATDRPVVRVAVTALIMREGKILLGKLKGSGLYVLPEGALEVGETVESAVHRAVRRSCGLVPSRVTVSKHAPYVSTFIEKAGQHFVSLVMLAECAGEPTALDPTWESCGWYDAEDPPEPRVITMQQIIDLARRNYAVETAPPLPSAEGVREKMAALKKVAKPKKPAKASSASRRS